MNMKIGALLLLVGSMGLLGCSPSPMGDAEKDTFKECLNKGWQPSYFSNGAKIEVSCVPLKPNKISHDSR